MSTRAAIIVERLDGTWKCVYCHWDGYLSGVGTTHFDHYHSQALAERLVELGAISSLGERCDLPPGHSHATPVPGYTVYYGRDRDDWRGFSAVAGSLEALRDQLSGWPDYVYVWRRERGWYVLTDQLTPLGSALIDGPRGGGR